MIDAIAAKAFSLDGTDYAKGDTVKMPLQQFEDLEPTGLVQRPAVEKKSLAKTKATDPKSSKTAD